MKNIDLSFALGLPPEDAIKYFQSKGFKFSYDWHETKNGAHSKAFTVAKAMKLDILSDIRESVDNSISKGMTFEEFRRELEPKLRSKGWWGKVKPSEVPTDNPNNIPKTPAGETDKMVQLGSYRRLQTIFQTNTQTAYSAGRYKQMVENSDDRPYWEYLALLDTRTRQLHRQLNGTVLRYDDPFWDAFFPPIAWYCRCHVRARSAEDIKKLKMPVIDSADKFSYEDVLINPDKPELGTIKVGVWKGSKQTVATEKGFGFNPGKNWDSWSDSVAWQKAEKLPDALKNKFVADMVSDDSRKEIFSDFIQKTMTDNKASGNSRVAGWMNETVYQELVKKNKQPQTPVIIMADKDVLHSTRDAKQKSKQALETDQLKLIPEIISKPDAVLFDTEDDAVIYSQKIDDTNSIKIVLKLNYKLKRIDYEPGQIRTVSKVETHNLNRSRYEILEGSL